MPSSTPPSARFRRRLAPLVAAVCAGVGVSIVVAGRIALAATPPPAAAQPAGPATADTKAAQTRADPRAAIAKKLDVRIEDVRPSPIAGLYEVVSGNDVLYVSPDGRFVVQGDMYDVDRGENVTEQRLTSLRTGALAELKAVGDDQAITFGPKDARYTVTVFTDVDCAYCRKLHSQIADYNKLGIRVRYLFYPRSGPNTSSWAKAEAVWCAPNRQEALTRAKAGEAVAAATKCPTPIAKTYRLAHELMLRGTPGIFTENNEYISGYLDPQALLDRLKQHEHADAKGASEKASGAAN